MHGCSMLFCSRLQKVYNEFDPEIGKLNAEIWGSLPRPVQQMNKV